MTSAGGLVIAVMLAGLAAAAPAAAQAPEDPIDALLRHPPAHRTVDPEEPDTAAEGTTAVAPDAPAPPAARAPPSRLTLAEPVYVEQTGRAPDGPPGPADVAYDNRLRASAAAAAGFQGPMEGGWTLSGGGGDLYVFELIDHDGVVDGAWRDPRRPTAPDASGFIDGAERSGDELTLRFAGSTVVLHAARGRWTGELREAGRTQAVSLARRNP